VIACNWPRSPWVLVREPWGAIPSQRNGWIKSAHPIHFDNVVRDGEFVEIDSRQVEHPVAVRAPQDAAAGGNYISPPVTQAELELQERSIEERALARGQI